MSRPDVSFKHTKHLFDRKKIDNNFVFASFFFFGGGGGGGGNDIYSYVYLPIIGTYDTSK